MQPTILLTGATGFLGRHLLEYFVYQKFSLIILTRTLSDTAPIKHLLSNVRIYNIDTVEMHTVFKNEKVDLIINTVCSYGRENESLHEIVNTNLIFGLNLLEHAVKNNVKTFINTDSLLPRNLNDYSLSKSHFAEWLFHLSDKIKVVNFKIEHMYGPKDNKKKFIPWLISEMINHSEDIHLTSGIQKRDFIYISDVVSAFDLVIQKKMSLPNWNQFDIGTNIFTEVREFIHILTGGVEKKYKREIFSRLKFGTKEYRKGDVMIPTLDNKGLIELGWKPTVTIIDGIKKILKD